MDLTVNDGLYHHFLKWRLKCKNNLEFELVALPEKQKCKEVIACSGDFGMGQYMSLSLPKEDLYLDAMWDRFKEFCKLQSNEVKACFDLLTSFCQGNKSMYKLRSIWPSTPLRLPRSCIMTSSGSS